MQKYGILVISAVCFFMILPAEAQFLYTNNGYSPNTVSAFAVSPSGTLTELPGSPFATGSSGGGGSYYATKTIVILPISKLLLAANYGSVSVFTIDATTGILTLVPGSPFPVGGTGTWYSGGGVPMAASPDEQFLFTSDVDSTGVFSITSGVLTPVPGSPFPLRSLTSQAGMRVTPDGKFVAVTMFDPFNDGSSVGTLVYSIGPGGVLTEVGTFFGGGQLMNGGGPEGIEANCSSKNLFTAEYNRDAHSFVDVYTVAANGVLTPITGSPFYSDTGGNSSVLQMSPDGRFLFVSNQDADDIQTFTVAGDGTLSLQSYLSFFPSTPVGLVMNQNGTSLYAALYSLTNPPSVAVLSVGQNGTLTPVPGSPFTVGQPLWDALAAFPPQTCTAGSVNPTSLTFAAQRVGTTSLPKSLALKNTGPTQMSPPSITISGDFSQTNTCSKGVRPATHCNLSVKFKPTKKGTRTGTISLFDNASSSPQTVTLSGIGK